MAGVDAHNRALRTRYVTLAARFPKNGPSPFRPVIIDSESVEAGVAIETEQAAIRERRSEQFRVERSLARDRKRLGVRNEGNAVPQERLSAGFKLIKEGLQE